MSDFKETFTIREKECEHLCVEASAVWPYADIPSYPLEKFWCAWSIKWLETVNLEPVNVDTPTHTLGHYLFFLVLVLSVSPIDGASADAAGSSAGAVASFSFAMGVIQPASAMSY